MKYHSKKCELDGYTFDSKREAKRYSELKMLENAGEIKNLKLQVPFLLIPKQTRIKNGKEKVIERECKYVADFVYLDKTGETVVEDTKGFKTKDYIIKRKLMLYTHGLEVKEV